MGGVARRRAGGLLGLVVAGLAIGCGERARRDAPQLPREDVLALVRRAAAYQVPRSMQRPNSWETATLFAAVATAWAETGEEVYRDWATEWAERQDWDRGRLACDANDQLCGQVYLELYEATGDAGRLVPLRRDVDAMLALPYPRPGRPVRKPRRKRDPKWRNSRLGWDGTGWHWCDALFMAPPVLARLAAVTGEQKYAAYLHRAWWDTAANLYDTDEHLWFRDGSFAELEHREGKKIFWARGNGWVMGGLVRVLQYLPADDPARPRYERMLRDMAAALVQRRSPDGFWRTDLRRPNAFPHPETSGTGLFCYALAWGVNRGLLNRETYGPVVERAWAALASSLNEKGRLLHVQPPHYEPSPGPYTDQRARDTEKEYGTGAFILAGLEVAKLSP